MVTVEHPIGNILLNKLLNLRMKCWSKPIENWCTTDLPLMPLIHLNFFRQPWEENILYQPFKQFNTYRPVSWPQIPYVWSLSPYSHRHERHLSDRCRGMTKRLVEKVSCGMASMAKYFTGKAPSSFWSASVYLRRKCKRINEMQILKLYMTTRGSNGFWRGGGEVLHMLMYNLGASLISSGT